MPNENAFDWEILKSRPPLYPVGHEEPINTRRPVNAAPTSVCLLGYWSYDACVEETPPDPAAESCAHKPAVGALITGLIVALFGYVAAVAQGMATAPSHAVANAALVIMILGCGLGLSGLASFWLPRVRRPAQIANYLTLALVLVAFVAGKVLAAVH